jgi:putative FmdB family regulatory protein
MPIYEYRCKDCGHQLEIIQKINDRPLRKCRECGGRLEKLISRAAFQLKGGGWYAEGYSKTGKSKSPGKKSESKKSESKGSGNSGGGSKSA